MRERLNCGSDRVGCEDGEVIPEATEAYVKVSGFGRASGGGGGGVDLWVFGWIVVCIGGFAVCICATK